MQNFSIEQILELARLAGEDDEHTLELIGMAAVSDDSETLQDVTEYLAYKAMPRIIDPDPFFPPPEPEQLEGEIRLGTVIDLSDI